jgi:hypothetical protein
LGLSLSERVRLCLALPALVAQVGVLSACPSSGQKSQEPPAESQPAAPSTGAPSPVQPSPAQPDPTVNPSAAPSPAEPPSGAAAALPATSASPDLDLAASFLVGTQGEAVSLRSLDGRTRTLVPAVSSWVYDPTHGLLWFLDEERLGVADLRNGTPPTTLAEGIPPVGSLWVEWPQKSTVQFVRPETGCEENADAIELKIRAKPSLRLVETDRRRSLSRDGLHWLQQQVKRAESPPARAESFDPGARPVALPKDWSGCDDTERCGLSAAFGASPLRLVLVRDDLGADCFHLRCLLHDAAANRFASPPVLLDEGGTASLAPQPPRWTSVQQAVPGSCGPYLFDTHGTAFLAHRFLCKLDGAKQSATCEELPGDGIGWLRAGVIAGRPG